jgi:alpha-beta hydrolase superfamily lysophospholipase
VTPLALLALGAAAAGGAYWLDRVANAVVSPKPRAAERSVPETGLAHEDIRVPGAGHQLAGWLLHGGPEVEGRPLLLVAHGWGANYGTVLRLAEPLVRAGHDVLLFDMRGHGRNLAVPFVTVRHLRDDVMAVVAYAAARFPRRSLVLVGHSFGGAACVLAAAERAPVAGLVLIATPSDVLRITAEFLRAKGMPGHLMVKVLRPFWWWRLGGTFRPHSPERRIGEVDLPLLIIQPEHDQRVRREHAERLSKAAGVPYQLVRGREHTDVLEAPETVELVVGFVAGLAQANPPEQGLRSAHMQT